MKPTEKNFRFGEFSRNEFMKRKRTTGNGKLLGQSSENEKEQTEDDDDGDGREAAQEKMKLFLMHNCNKSAIAIYIRFRFEKATKNTCSFFSSTLNSCCFFSIEEVYPLSVCVRRIDTLCRVFYFCSRKKTTKRINANGNTK